MAIPDLEGFLFDSKWAIISGVLGKIFTLTSGVSINNFCVLKMISNGIKIDHEDEHSNKTLVNRRGKFHAEYSD